MITGYNTEVRRGGTVFHVQTEDKGRDNPVLETLVYVGGRVVSSKRTTYEDLDPASGDGEIWERMDHQHRTVVAAIRAGRLDTALAGTPASAASSRTGGNGHWRRAPDLSLDEAMLAFLAERAEGEGLELRRIDDSEIGGGRTVELQVQAVTRSDARPLADVELDVQLISPQGGARPVVSLRTDAEGKGSFRVLLSQRMAGGSAIVVRGRSDELGRSQLVLEF